MTFRAHAPAPALRPWVDRFWTKQSEQSPVQRVVPDGCVDVIVHLQGRPRVDVVGTMTRALVVPAGPVSVVAVRLRPGVARALLGTPAAELTDAHVDLAQWSCDRHALLDAVASASEERGRVAALERWIVRALARAAAPDRAVLRAVDRLAADPGVRVGPLADEIGCTRQHLARAFARDVGIGPKEFARVMRLGRVLGRLRPGSAPPWAALAADAGYADQSHLVHEFTVLVGTTPARFARELGEAGSILPIQPVGAAPDCAASEETPCRSPQT